jgi:dipeptide/tripeptide permease
VAEKLAVVGFSTNMLIYLTQQMHMPLTKAATTLTNFGGTSAMTPLIGAYLADAVIGRFWTIAGASLVYQVVRAHIETHIYTSLLTYKPKHMKELLD